MAIIKNIELYNFRNFNYFQNSFNNKLNIFFGNNGCGKTNILEALSLLSKGRGIRNTNFSNLIKNNEKNFKIKNKLEVDKNIFDTEIYLENNNEKYRKIIKLNDDTSKDSLDFLNKSISFLTFLPEMERLFQSSPSYRRNFLDRLIFSGRNDYNKLVNKYKKSIIERLKVLQQHNYDDYWLNQIEREISATGLEIYKARDTQLKYINSNINNLNNSKKFKFIIKLNIKDNFYNSELDLDKYKLALYETRNFDKINGGTRIGPHRSDINANIDKEHDASLLSTGQQKTVVLMILLVQCHFLIYDKKITPIILFDEIASHLDELNRHLLLDMINSFEIQFFLTGTDKNLFSFMSTNAEFYNISSV